MGVKFPATFPTFITPRLKKPQAVKVLPALMARTSQKIERVRLKYPPVRKARL